MIVCDKCGAGPLAEGPVTIKADSKIGSLPPFEIFELCEQCYRALRELMTKAVRR